MKAVVEEGDETLAARMQHLALSEAALPRHLLTAFYTKKPAGLKLIYVSPYLNTFKIFIIIIQDL
jgi:DnaJ family protein C protein 13